MRTILLALVAAAVPFGAAGCTAGYHERLVRVPALDRWCDDRLCAWTTERGTIRPVGTWHPRDLGASLVDEDTAIEHVMYETSVSEEHCVVFEMMANAGLGARLHLNVDVNGDGRVEQNFKVVTEGWQPQSFRFLIAPPFTGIGLEIVKTGAGAAAIARMRTTVLDHGCGDLDPLDGGPAPLGAACLRATDCASAICASRVSGPGVCSECERGASGCPDGVICGLADRERPQYLAHDVCTPPAARLLAENCGEDAECQSGICVSGVCSSCRDDADCAGPCKTAYPNGPRLCNPFDRVAQRGAPCVTSFECVSGICRGETRGQCFDGRACDAPADCLPFPAPATDYRRFCNVVGIQGGVCD
jgi:hypothetical protein